MEPPSTRGFTGTNRKIYHCTGGFGTEAGVMGQAVTSCHVFTIKTPDPKKWPLPRSDLLDMRWYFQRVAGMSGAAEPEDLPTFDDEEYVKNFIEKWLESLPYSRPAGFPMDVSVLSY
jgi:hypothetical protein